MRAWRFTPWLSTFLVSVWIAVGLAFPGPAAAAGSPGPGGSAITPQSSIASTPTAIANTPNGLPAANWDADTSTQVGLSQPADAFGDPLYWAVMGLVVLGHFVLAADFHQGQ